MGSFFRLLVIFTCLLNVEALVAYDCSHGNTGIKDISLVDVKTCVPKLRNVTKVDAYIQLIQPKYFETTPYFQCLVEVTHLIFRCGKTIDTHHQGGLYSEVLSLSRDECNTLITRGEFKYQGFLVIIDITKNVNRISMETYGTINSGSCTPGSYDYALVINGVQYDRAVRTSNFIITTKRSIATVDIETRKIILDDGIKCDYNPLSCFSSDNGFVFWESMFENPSCNSEDEYYPIFEGHATKYIEYVGNQATTSVIIHYSNYDFQIALLGKTKRICGQISYLTEHPKLAIVFSTKTEGFNLKINSASMSKNVNLMAYVNSKIVYVLRHVKEQVDSLYDRVSHDRCIAETKIIHNMLALAVISPQEFAYEYFNAPGHTAVVLGETIYVSKCVPVSVNFTKVANKCYKELPVTVNGETMFMLPRSRILSGIGTEVDCSGLLTVKYKLTHEWYTVGSNLIVTSAPERLDFSNKDDWTFRTIDDLIETGIYTLEDLEAVQKIIMTPIQKNALTERISRTIQGESELPTGSNVIHLFTEEDLKTLAKDSVRSVLGSIADGIHYLGDICSFIVGSFIILRFIKFILNFIINGVLIFKKYGLNWRLLICWWENIVHIMLSGYMSKMRDEKEENESTAPLDTIRVSEDAYTNGQPLLLSERRSRRIVPVRPKGDEI
ncbi:glycoprotein [Hymenopteran anphe-related virus OKIAV71]|uniref:Glycoprotein n=1 Tax=Hymenopteran anphe-related virus OKIAV71 TaxID=2792596 RepID=A0AAE7PF28_9MONO|nr:glycoprotein [Hymenopteran anphe-related virus OKIAV71]QPL15378.1 glycoprotein [Hymenopteran anphe-related virus OKIAV71]